MRRKVNTNYEDWLVITNKIAEIKEVIRYIERYIASELTPIDVLPLNKHLRRKLKSAHIYTIDELQSLVKARKLIQIRGIGELACTEIVKVLSEYEERHKE